MFISKETYETVVALIDEARFANATDSQNSNVIPIKLGSPLGYDKKLRQAREEIELAYAQMVTVGCTYRWPWKETVRGYSEYTVIRIREERGHYDIRYANGALNLISFASPANRESVEITVEDGAIDHRYAEDVGCESKLVFSGEPIAPGEYNVDANDPAVTQMVDLYLSIGIFIPKADMRKAISQFRADSKSTKTPTPDLLLMRYFKNAEEHDVET